jgi:hypothetical protein
MTGSRKALHAWIRRRLFVKEILMESAKNMVMGCQVVQRARLRWSPRTTISAVDPAVNALDRYAFALPRVLLKAVGQIEGKSIAEIGPGDHIASGLVMLAAGAASYSCLDRFPGDYANAYAKEWYRAVRNAWPSAFPSLSWPRWLDVEDFPEAYPHRVTIQKAGVEATSEMLPPCDVVCSHAVGEHVLDVAAFAKVSRDMLRPGGVAVHVIDFSQHFDWSWYGDRFLFLSINDRLWKWMGSNRGLPNRVGYQEFREILAKAGLQVETAAKRVADEHPNPGLLAARFRHVPIESLRTLEATFLCRPQAAPYPSGAPS